MSERHPCCDPYRDDDRTDPSGEQRAGRVRIVETSEPGWSMTYRVECATCARRFIVKQIDGPALRWKWVPQGEKRRRA